MKKIVLGIISSLILTTNVLANEIETKKVITTGTGLTESEALKDTTRNAVQQVVGAYILSDTYVKNFQLIKDEILTNSNGYVKGFKIISQTKDSTGIIRIEAEVEVEPNNVTKRLGELNIVLKDVATTEFKAISLDKFQASKDFKRMFDEIVLKPIKENKKIYDIKIGELKSVDKMPDYFRLSNNNDSLMPFILSFSVDLKKDYIDSIKSFLEKESTSKYNYYIPASFDNYDNSFIFKVISINGLENRSIYSFNDNLKNSYQILAKELNNNYNPILIIKLNDSSNQIIKSLNLSSYNGENCTLVIKKNYNSYSYDDSNWLYGFYKYGYDTLSIIESSKNLELGIYLNEDEISKIKSASIEIKWEKK